MTGQRPRKQRLIGRATLSTRCAEGAGQGTYVYIYIYMICSGPASPPLIIMYIYIYIICMAPPSKKKKPPKPENAKKYRRKKKVKKQKRNTETKLTRKTKKPDPINVGSSYPSSAGPWFYFLKKKMCVCSPGFPVLLCFLLLEHPGYHFLLFTGELRCSVFRRRVPFLVSLSTSTAGDVFACHFYMERTYDRHPEENCRFRSIRSATLQG